MTEPNQENDSELDPNDGVDINQDHDQQQQQHFEAGDIDLRQPPQQFQQQYADNQFRSPLFNTPPPNFANNNVRMPGNNNFPNRFWHNPNQQQTGNNNFSPRQWNSPQNFRPGGNINVQQQQRPQLQMRGGIMGGNFNSPQNLANMNFNAATSPHSNNVMGGNFNPMQNFANFNNNNNLNRFNAPQNLNTIRSQLVNRFNAQPPQPLMSIVTQTEIDEGVDGPIIQENDELPMATSHIVDSVVVVGDKSLKDCDDMDKADEVSSKVSDNEVDGSLTGGDVDMRGAKPMVVNVVDEQKSNSGDHSNDSSHSSAANSSVGGQPKNLDSSSGTDQEKPIAKPARKPNPFSKPPSVVIPPIVPKQKSPRSLLDLPTTPILPPGTFSGDILPINNNNINQFGSPQMSIMMDNDGEGGGGGVGMRGGGQQQFFSPQQQTFSPNQMRGGNNSPYFRQNRGGPIGGPGRPPFSGIMNRGAGGGGGGGGAMNRGGGGRGNFRGNW